MFIGVKCTVICQTGVDFIKILHAAFTKLIFNPFVMQNFGINQALIIRQFAQKLLNRMLVKLRLSRGEYVCTHKNYAKLMAKLTKEKDGKD